jgi:predicted kinase
MNLDKIEKPYVIILIGPPLVGKSTWIKNNFASDEEVEVISRDEIVMNEYGSMDYDEAFRNVDQKQVNKILEYKLIDANLHRRNVVVDMTNMTSKRRRHTLSYFDQDYTKVAIIFPILEIEELMIRNKKRKEIENKSIPEQVVRNMIASYQPVRSDEGFDRVTSI